jgi:hypothetical protein
VIWHPEHDLDGSLRYVLRNEPRLLPLAVLVRKKGSEWALWHADGMKFLRGTLPAVKNQAEGMLGL